MIETVAEEKVDNSDEKVGPLPSNQTESNTLDSESSRKKTKNRKSFVPDTLGKRAAKKTIKMNGWLEYCDETDTKWQKRWCTLEGGYIWLFENEEDGQKNSGISQPLSMINMSKAIVSRGNFAELFSPQGANENTYLFTVTIGTKRQILMAAPNLEEWDSWINAFDNIIKRKK